MDDALIRRIVEAALLAAGQPLSLAQLHELFPEDAPAPADAVERALQTLRDEAPQRGVELVEVASGFRFQIGNEVQPWVARLWAERQTKYSRASLETLALIAYRQPITRGEIEQIRGVAVSSNIIRTLEEREWVRVVGHRDVPGKPALYGTTRGFLDYFGLKSLDQLPPLTELHDIPDLEPQLALEPVAPRAASEAANETIADIATDESEVAQPLPTAPDGSIAANESFAADESAAERPSTASTEDASQHADHPSASEYSA